MSNTWNYSLILGNESRVSGETLVVIVQALSQMGYSVWNLGFRKITGMSADGLYDLSFDDWEAAQSYLCSYGGMITIWKALESSDFRAIHLIIAPDREVGLFINGDLRKNREEDAQMAADLESLFVALCSRLDPVYGYSTDEYRLETLFPGAEVLRVWADLQQAPATLTPPPILFWLNYFSQVYLEHITEQRFVDLSLRKEATCRGVYIRLAQHPWDAQIAVLEKDGRYRPG